VNEVEIEDMLGALESTRGALQSAQSALDQLRRETEELRQAHEKATSDREQYRALYMQMLERCRLLERGIVAGKKAERFAGDDANQLSMQLLGMLLAEGETPTEEAAAEPLAYLRDLLCLLPTKIQLLRPTACRRRSLGKCIAHQARKTRPEPPDRPVMDHRRAAARRWSTPTRACSRPMSDHSR
jgi:uncharacterized protein YukE